MIPIAAAVLESRYEQATVDWAGRSSSPVQSDIDDIDTLVKSLKNDASYDIFATLDVLCVASSIEANSLLNIVQAAHDGTNESSLGTFVTDKGWPAVDNGYIDSNFSAGYGTGNLLTNDYLMGIYLSDPATTDDSVLGFRHLDASQSYIAIFKDSSNQPRFLAQTSNGVSWPSAAPGHGAQQLWKYSDGDNYISQQNTSDGYIDGTWYFLSAGPIVGTDIAAVDMNMYVGTINIKGTADTPGIQNTNGAHIQAWWCGGANRADTGLSEADAEILSTAIHDYFIRKGTEA